MLSVDFISVLPVVELDGVVSSLHSRQVPLLLQKEWILLYKELLLGILLSLQVIAVSIHGWGSVLDLIGSSRSLIHVSAQSCCGSRRHKSASGSRGPQVLRNLRLRSFSNLNIIKWRRIIVDGMIQFLGSAIIKALHCNLFGHSLRLHWTGLSIHVIHLSVLLSHGSEFRTWFGGLESWHIGNCSRVRLMARSSNFIRLTTEVNVRTWVLIKVIPVKFRSSSSSSPLQVIEMIIELQWFHPDISWIKISCAIILGTSFR